MKITAHSLKKFFTWKIGALVLLLAGFVAIYDAETGNLSAVPVDSPDMHNVATSDELIASYGKVVHESDYSKAETIYPVEKWIDPIRVSYFGNMPAWHRGIMGEQMKELTRLTGIDFKIIGNSDRKANIHIHFVNSSEEMFTVSMRYGGNEEITRKVVSEASCMGDITNKQSGETALGVIIISRKKTQAHKSLPHRRTYPGYGAGCRQKPL